MENQQQTYEMNDNQRRVFIDAAQLHEAYKDTFNSLGPQSPETEAVFNQFHQKKSNYPVGSSTSQPSFRNRRAFAKPLVLFGYRQS
jgi:hypothetical protein